MCRLSWNLGAWTSWNPQGLSGPVMRLLYLFYHLLHGRKSNMRQGNAFKTALSVFVSVIAGNMTVSFHILSHLLLATPTRVFHLSLSCYRPRLSHPWYSEIKEIWLSAGTVKGSVTLMLMDRDTLGRVVDCCIIADLSAKRSGPTLRFKQSEKMEGPWMRRWYFPPKRR